MNFPFLTVMTFAPIVVAFNGLLIGQADRNGRRVPSPFQGEGQGEGRNSGVNE